MHTRLRTQFSALNSHLFNKNISEEVKKLANISYYIILTDTPVLTITTDLLLFGSEHLFDAVFKFISESKRFGN